MTGSPRVIATLNSSFLSSALLPSGEIALAMFSDSRILVVNITTGAVVRTLTGHTVYPRSLVVLPTGELASCSRDESIRIWNLQSGQLVRNVTFDGWVDFLAVLPNGLLASAASDGSSIRLINTTTGQVERIIDESEGSYKGCLLVLPSGAFAAGVSNIIDIWSLQNYKINMVLRGHTDIVLSLVSLPNGGLASGSSDKTIRIWNLLSGETRRVLQSTNSVESLLLLPGGQLLSQYRSFPTPTGRIWNLQTGKLLQNLTRAASL